MLIAHEHFLCVGDIDLLADGVQQKVETLNLRYRCELPREK